MHPGGVWWSPAKALVLAIESIEQTVALTRTV